MIRLWYNIRLFTFIYNYKVDRKFDAYINDCLKSGIEGLLWNEVHEQCVKFENGTVMEFWISNKWYAWMSRGKFIFNNKTEWKWDEIRPKAKTMFLFNKALENFKPPIVIESNPFNI